MCEMHLGIPKFDVAPIVIRYRVTGVLVNKFLNKLYLIYSAARISLIFDAIRKQTLFFR